MNKEKPHWKTVFLWITTVSLILSIVLIYFFPYCDNSVGRTETDRTVTFDQLGHIYYLLGLVSWVACIVSGLLAMSLPKKVGLIGWMTVFAMFALPVVGAICVLRDIDPFEDLAVLKDGKDEYHLFYSSFMQGREIAIGKLESKFLFRSTYRIVARAPGERMFGVLNVVRKQGASDDTLFTLTPKRIILGGLSTNEALVAYDIDRKVGYMEQLNNDSHQVNQLSPFLPLGPNDTPDEADFKHLLSPGYAGALQQTVEPDLSNPNPRVREMAKAYLAKYPLK